MKTAVSQTLLESIGMLGFISQFFSPNRISHSDPTQGVPLRLASYGSSNKQSLQCPFHSEWPPDIPDVSVPL